MAQRRPDRRPRADIKAVARRAGVSTATVSRALRGLPNVSAEARDRVLAAARELDYVASPSASRLASGRTGSVAVVIPFIGRYYFGLVLDGAEAVLRQAGYDVLLYSLPDAAAREVFFARMPLRRRVDGVLAVALPLLADQAERLRDRDLPVETVGFQLPGAGSVRIDDHLAAHMATTHLINLGHERIAMIGGGAGDAEPNPLAAPQDRAAGYRAALADAGLAWTAGYEVDGLCTATGAEQALAQLFSLPEPPTAVFAQSDRMALGAMHGLRRAGLSCPGDVSIVGFDDHELAEPAELTTISQPMAEQGALAAGDLLRRLDGGPVEHRVLPTHLVLRASTSPPREAREHG